MITLLYTNDLSIINIYFILIFYIDNKSVKNALNTYICIYI